MLYTKLVKLRRTPAFMIAFLHTVGFVDSFLSSGIPLRSISYHQRRCEFFFSKDARYNLNFLKSPTRRSAARCALGSSWPINKGVRLDGDNLFDVPIFRANVLVLPGQHGELHLQQSSDQEFFRIYFADLVLTNTTANQPNLLALILQPAHYAKHTGYEANAPITGTLVDICSVSTLRDGSLLAHGAGICRIIIRDGTVAISPDEEDVAAQAPIAGGEVMREVRRCESLSQDVLAAVHNGFFRGAAAAAAAACAAWGNM